VSYSSRPTFRHALTDTYVWKTSKNWKGKCGTFTLKLDDGTEHTADFQFK
jgi:hypothetical protein